MCPDGFSGKNCEVSPVIEQINRLCSIGLGLVSQSLPQTGSARIKINVSFFPVKATLTLNLVIMM